MLAPVDPPHRPPADDPAEPVLAERRVGQVVDLRETVILVAPRRGARLGDREGRAVGDRLLERGVIRLEEPRLEGVQNGAGSRLVVGARANVE